MNALQKEISLSHDVIKEILKPLASALPAGFEVVGAGKDLGNGLLIVLSFPPPYLKGRTCRVKGKFL